MTTRSKARDRSSAACGDGSDEQISRSVPIIRSHDRSHLSGVGEHDVSRRSNMQTRTASSKQTSARSYNEGKLRENDLNPKSQAKRMVSRTLTNVHMNSCTTDDSSDSEYHYEQSSSDSYDDACNTSMSYPPSSYSCQTTQRKSHVKHSRSYVSSHSVSRSDRHSTRNVPHKHQSSSNPHIPTSVTNSVAHRYINPEIFKGETSLEYYLEKFDEVADWNQWTDRERAQQLRFSLSDHYTKALKSVPKHLKYDLSAVKSTLREFVGEDYSHDGRDAEAFWQRTLKPNEKIQEYAVELQILGEKAFIKNPDFAIRDESTYQKTLLNRFLTGLLDPHLERWLYKLKPIDLRQAVTAAIEYKAFDKDETHSESKPIIAHVSENSKQPCQSESTKLDKIVQLLSKLTTQVEEIGRQCSENSTQIRDIESIIQPAQFSHLN